MNAIGFIGVGELALYTIKGVRRGGYQEPIILSARNAAKAKLLASQYACEIAVDNQSLVDNCQHIVISTRPEDCLETLAALEFKSARVLISVVAGIEIRQIQSVVPANVDIVRAMPVTSAEFGASPTLIFPEQDFTQEFFDYCGNAIPVSHEAYFTQGTVLACAYSWFFALFEALISATQGPDLPRHLSAQLVMGMAQGAAEQALTSGQNPGEIAAQIATDGTYSRLGLDLLEQQSAFDPWRDACELLRQQLAAKS